VGVPLSHLYRLGQVAHAGVVERFGLEAGDGVLAGEVVPENRLVVHGFEQLEDVGDGLRLELLRQLRAQVFEILERDLREQFLAQLRLHREHERVQKDLRGRVPLPAGVGLVVPHLDRAALLTHQVDVAGQGPGAAEDLREVRELPGLEPDGDLHAHREGVAGQEMVLAVLVAGLERGTVEGKGRTTPRVSDRSPAAPGARLPP